MDAGQPVLGSVQACREEGAGSPCVSSRKVIPSQPLARAWHSCLYENEAHAASWQGCAQNSGRAPPCGAGKGERSDACPLITQTGSCKLASFAVGKVGKSSPEDSPGETVSREKCFPAALPQVCLPASGRSLACPRTWWHRLSSQLRSAASNPPSQSMDSFELSSKNAFRCLVHDRELWVVWWCFGEILYAISVKMSLSSQGVLVSSPHHIPPFSVGVEPWLLGIHFWVNPF